MNLTNHPALDAFPSWSPLGPIAFYSNRDGDWEIYVMEPDGSNVRRLTHSPGFDAYPSFSRDGSKILFHSHRLSGEEGGGDIFIMDADGSNQRPLIVSPGEDSDPCWCSASDRFVFSSDRDGDYEIFIVNIDGSGLTQLTHNTVSDIEPDCWEPGH